jgi:sulfatase-like protein
MAHLFSTAQGCGENQGVWDAILTIETAIDMNAPNELPKDRGLLKLTTASLLLLLAAVTVSAQRITGTPGSPSATTTIDGRYLPPPPPPFGGIINRSASESKPWWPPRVVPPKDAPNVLLIMTDDAGYGVPSTFGGIIPTPALDRIAKMGLRYTQFHSTALCSPTRAALITGRNHHSVGFGSNIDVPPAIQDTRSTRTKSNSASSRQERS